MLKRSIIWERRSLLALLLIVFALLIWRWPPKFLFQPLQAGLSTVAFPFEQLLSRAAFELSEAGTFIRSVGSLKSENVALAKERLRLQAEVASIKRFERENEELRSLLALQEKRQATLIPAEVIGREGSGRSTRVTLNRGSLEGVEPGQPVVAEKDVLVGVVERVAPTTAVVRLLPDAESLVSASIASSASQGVVRGDHGLGLVFDLALEQDTLRPGEAVVTSGVGDHYPPGLLIGTIDQVRPSADRLFQQAVVLSPLKFDTLRFVGIIRSGN